MECRDRITKSPSGNEGHGVHVCHKCGWLFPNPHPSARHRRAHKKVCGTIEVKPGNSGDHKTNLGDSDEEHLSDNDSKTLINGSEAMEKVEEMAVSRRSISGFGSGSNRSTRSEEDVFSDAVADFPDSSAVSDSDDVKESGKKQDFSEDDPVVQRVEVNGAADAGGSDTHNNDVPSQYHLSSSTLDSSSNSGLAVREEESSVLGLEEKGSVKGVQDKKSEDIENIPSENDGITFEAVFVPQKVNKDILEFLPADAAVDVIGNQSDLLDEKRDCSPKDEQINSLENSSQATEDSNVNAGNIHVLVIPDPVQEVEYVAEPSENPDKNCKGIIISEALHQVDNFADEVSVERGIEKTDSHAIDVDISGPNSVVAEPSENPDKNSKGIISEALHQEDNFAEEVSVERETEKTDSHATDVDISGPNSVVVHLDEDIEEAGQGKTAAEVQNSLVFTETNLHSFLDDGDSHTRSISTVKPVGDDSEDDNEDAEMLNALEADSIKEKNLIREGNGDESTPNVPEFEDGMENKMEADRKYEQVLEVAAASDSSNASLLKCDVQMKKLENSEVTRELMVVGESASAVATDSISSVGDEVNAQNHEICVHKASDSMDVSLTEKVMDNGAQLEKIEVSSDKMTGEECFGKVDLGLISDNDDISDLTQSAANSSNARVHEEAASAVEDRFTKERDGTASALTDIQADSLSPTYSLEGNWGSISVLSTLSDAPAATDTGSQPSQESYKAENAVLQPKPDKGTTTDQNDCTPESQASQKPQEQGGGGFPSLTPMSTNESPGKKKNEEIVAKVTNWRTDKQHLPLKSYLGESSPSAKDNPPAMETISTVMSTKENMDKEWNSPARYSSNIKREKGKVRKPYWAPFICCSSVQTS